MNNIKLFSFCYRSIESICYLVHIDGRTVENSFLSKILINAYLEGGCIEQSMCGLCYVGRVKAVMEGIVLDVMILEGHHEGHEGLRRNRERFEQVATLEGRVGHARQRSVVA